MSPFADQGRAVKQERARLRRGVEAGELSLTVLLEARTKELEGVVIVWLVGWLPRVGTAKTTSLLKGLPHYYTLKMLTPEERIILTSRIRNRENTYQRSA